MKREPTWWLWLATSLMLMVGLVFDARWVWAAVTLVLAQAVWFWAQHKSLRPYAVQIRLAYAFLVGLLAITPLNQLIWVPAIGAMALVVFGYCLMGRFLSLMPWNAARMPTMDLIRRTFFTPPDRSNPSHGLPGTGGPVSQCEMEARIAERLS